MDLYCGAVSVQFAQIYSVTLPTESSARALADRLAERGHRLVAVRIVDHFTFDPSSFWYGKPSMRPEYAGWWDVFSVVQDPPLPDEAQEWAQRCEWKAVAALAREHGGVASGPGGGDPDTVGRLPKVERALDELDFLDRQDSPFAATEHRALCALEDLLIEELERAQA